MLKEAGMYFLGFRCARTVYSLLVFRPPAQYAKLLDPLLFPFLPKLVEIS